MKKIIVLFLCMYTLTFSIVDFPNLRWNDKIFDVMMAYPGVQEEESFYNGVEVYVIEDPENMVASYKFYLIDGSLYKIQVNFDPEQVDTTSKIRDIYNSITDKFGNPIAKNPISETLITTKVTGNSQTFKADKDTLALFKGLDTFDTDGNMIDSQLLLEYRNTARVNVYP